MVPRVTGVIFMQQQVFYVFGELIVYFYNYLNDSCLKYNRTMEYFYYQEKVRFYDHNKIMDSTLLPLSGYGNNIYKTSYWLQKSQDLYECHKIYTADYIQFEKQMNM